MTLFHFFHSHTAAANKKLMRVNLSVCPKGIEVLDSVSGETLHGIPITRISYCSADGAHSKVFAFVSSGVDQPADNNNASAVDELTCYAFLCGKRKMAHNLTITVAKNFERAFNVWKKFDQTKTKTECRDEAKRYAQIGGSDAHRRDHNDNNGCDNVLIDFDSDGAQRHLLHTAWVSFDDDTTIDNANKQPPSRMIEWQQNLVY